MESNITNLDYDDLIDTVEYEYREKYHLDDDVKLCVNFLCAYYTDFIVYVQEKNKKNSKGEYFLIETYLEDSDDFMCGNFDVSILPKDQCQKLMNTIYNFRYNYISKLQFMTIAKENDIDCENKFQCNCCDKYEECQQSWDDWCDGESYWNMIDDGMN